MMVLMTCVVMVMIVLRLGGTASGVAEIVSSLVVSVGLKIVSQ